MGKIAWTTERGNNMVRILKWVGFVASGIISFMLMTTLCNTYFDYILAFAMTVVLQASSFYFFDKAIKEKKHVKKFFSSTLALLLFLISIVGTISFQFGIQNNIQNEMVTNSDSYRIAQENREIKKKNVSNKERQIETLESNLAAQIATLDESIAEYRRLEKAQNQLYTFRISQINKEKTQLRADFAGKMDNLNNELSSLSQQASTEFKVDTNIELVATKGYLPLMEALSKWFGVDMIMLTLVFQSFIACIFELTAIYLHIEDISAQSRKRAEIQPKQSDELSKKRASKPSNQTDKPSNEEIENFIQAKKKHPTLGYKGISKKIGIAEGKCSKIQVHLVDKGILKKSGNTYKVG